MTIEEKALEFANKLEKQTSECPRGCLNPGLYFGYVTGYEAMKVPSDLALARKNIEIHELKERLSTNCPFNCYYEGKHPTCDSDDCDYLGYAFKDVK